MNVWYKNNKIIYKTIIIFHLLIFCLQTKAQIFKCGDENSLYFTKNIYNSSYMKTYTYANNVKLYNGANSNQTFDIYYPGNISDNPANTKRPTIVLFHGGGMFMGSKSEEWNMVFKDKLVKKGYNVVCADYRLGWNNSMKNNDISQLCATTPAGEYADCFYRASQDARACVRYLKANANNLLVDENNIFAMGISGGAIQASTFMGDDANIFTNERITKLGDINTSGNNYTNDYKVAGLILVAGAKPDKDIQFNKTPVCFFHGTCDYAAPYGEGYMLTCQSFCKLFGPDVLTKKLTEQNIYNEFYSFCNYLHDLRSKEDTKPYDTYSFTFVAENISKFINNVMCNNTSEAKEVSVTKLPEFPYSAVTSACTEGMKYKVCDPNFTINKTKLKTSNTNVNNTINTTVINTTNLSTSNNNNISIKLLNTTAVKLKTSIRFLVNTTASKNIVANIYNLNGKKISTFTIEPKAGETTYKLPSSINIGFYFIEFLDNNVVVNTDVISIKKI